jgi:hemerythrin-like domain-containing protein
MMTKRRDALIPLTHDHHHALVRARALISVASESDDAARTHAAESFIRFYRNDTLLHFHEEEEVLFPKLLEYVEEVPEELARVLIDHVRIHGMVARLQERLPSGAPDGRSLRELGELLRAHVRLEENQLFPLIERVVPERDLQDVSFAERHREP